MDLPNDLARLTRKDLQTLVFTLLEELTTLRQEINQLRQINAAQRDKLEQLEREGKRQVAPFGKAQHSKKRQRAGRKAGQGEFRHRDLPDPEEVTEPPVEVLVEESVCPSCGGELVENHTDIVYRTELPATPKPQITPYRVMVCRCRTCGKTVRGRHPEVAPDQYGATAHRVGERLLAVAHGLHYGIGIPMRKVPLVLQEMTGVRLTQGAIMQDALKRARAEMGERYTALRAQVKTSAQVYTDDTGWKVGGNPAFLMVFETDETTVYQIRAQHRNEEVREIIPADYPGVMSTDRGRSYDADALQAVKQQKCMSHIQRSLQQVLDAQTGAARQFPVTLKKMLKTAVTLWHRYHTGNVKNYPAKAAKVKAQIDHHLRKRTLRNAENQRLLNELRKHHQRGNLLRFLNDPRIEPTNNRAERALRPAVIARKVSQCSKNDRGAYAFAVFKSVTQHIRKTGGSIIEGLYSIFCASHPQQASP